MSVVSFSILKMMRMKKMVLIFLVPLLFVISVVGQQFSAGIVYGPKAAYKIDAPKNWVLDNAVGRSIGLPCVLYINGYTWENSPVVMYAKIAGTIFENIDSFILFAIKDFKNLDSTFYHNELNRGKVDSFQYIVMDYQGGPYKSYERVFYVQMPKAVGYVVFSARNNEDFMKYSNDIIEVILSFKYKPEFIGFKN